MYIMHSIRSIFMILVLCGTISMGTLYDNFYNMNESYGIYEYNDLFDTDNDIGELKLRHHLQRDVDNFLFHCLNETHQMLDHRGDVFSWCYRTGTMILHRCVRELYICLKSSQKKKEKKSDSWDDIFGTQVKISSKVMSETFSPQRVTNDSVVETGCQLDFGSISRMPAITMCFILQNNKTVSKKMYETAMTSCDEQSHTVIPLSSSLPCSHSQHATTMAHFKAAWLLAKFNYGLIITSTLCVLLPTMRSVIIRLGTSNSRSVLLFGVLNVLWMIWRLQETLQWDTKWQDEVPYICVATNTLQYLVEAVALFLFVCTSLDRYRAISGSLLSIVSRKKEKLVVLSLIVGVITGGSCSILNITALSVMTSPSALLLKRCSIPNDVRDNLIILIIAKVVSLVAMYLVPCGIMSAANIAMILSVRRQSKKNLDICYHRKHKSRKTSMISGFLVFSSVFMVCSVSKPIFEVYLAIKIHMGVSAKEDRDTVGILLDAITWNLTTIAYTINTMMGLRFTK